MLKLAWKYMRYYKSQTLAIFVSIVLTAALLAGIGSLIYSSQKSDLANSKNIYGDWHYYVEADEEAYESIGDGETGKGYDLKQCGKLEIREVVSEEFDVRFIHADETYRQMAHRDLLEGNFPKKENEIAADGFVLSSLGFSGNPGDSIHIGERDYVVTGILKSQWAADADEMEIFVSDTFGTEGEAEDGRIAGGYEGKPKRARFLYLRFDEEEKLYQQLDAFLNTYQLNAESVVGNDEVTRYLGGEAPAGIYEILKFGLTDEEGNFTYILLKLESDYNLAYNGMIGLLCLFSIFVVYSVFNISVSRRTSEYGMLKTLGISEKQIGGTLLLELWTLFFLGYPLGCLAGNGILSLVFRKFSGVFGGKGIGVTERTLSGADRTLEEGTNAVSFEPSWSAMISGFVVLLILLAAAAQRVVRSLRKRSLQEVMCGDTSFAKKRKIYALRPVPMAGIVVRKFMFANKKKVVGILISLSMGGCIFLCTTYMVENLKIHAELSLKSDDGLGSKYRISLKSHSLIDFIPEAVANQIKSMPETEHVYATKYTLSEMIRIEELEWEHYFDQQNQVSSFRQRFGGICVRQDDGTYRIKYDMYGYDQELLEQLGDFILEGEIDPEEIRDGNQIVAVANMDGQGNYCFYGKTPGDTVTLRVPRTDGYNDELLKFQGNEECYVEREFEIAAIVSRPLAREQEFLNSDVWDDSPSVIMTNEQMTDNFGITGYRFIHASPAEGVKPQKVSGQLLQAVKDVPKAVLQDYSEAIAAQKNYLKQRQIFFSSIAVILLVISLFHIANSMNHTIFARRREYGILRAMGITDGGFCQMILQTGILYGVLADVFIFLIYNLVLRRVMDYYMAHILQFLHLTAEVPNQVLVGIMILNIVIAVGAVTFPAWKMVRENMISQITR